MSSTFDPYTAAAENPNVTLQDKILGQATFFVFYVSHLCS